jgi:hypothetical protein
MLPVAAQAAEPANNEQLILMNKAQTRADKVAANAANRAARCALVAAGVPISGKLQLFECGNARALQTLPGGAAITCPAAGGVLNKVEANMVNNYLIKKAKAEKKGDLAPTPRADVAALIACS